MSAGPVRLAARPRWVLGELNPARDLNTPRGLYKRDPIVFEKENAAAVIAGLQLGIYDLDEVIALTNFRLLPSPATARYHSDSADEFSHPADAALEPGEMSDEELVEEYGEDDDELLVDAVTGEFVEEIDEHDENSESDEELRRPVFDPAALGLKEINNLAHFGVSSHRPGNGVAELLSEDLDKYWQSDGQQPHLLTIHFLRRVEIRAIRFYVDYNQDESYTPTHIVFFAGTGQHDLIQFAEVPLNNPVGWQDVPIADCGGGADGHSLCCWMVQMHIKENHQNGKDTHIRGIKIYALDDQQTLGGPAREPARGSGNDPDDDHARVLSFGEGDERLQELLDAFDRHPLSQSFSNVTDLMRDPVIR
ncbi:anaphase-promoting complex subunit 10 [Achaetomium macrosporum]|uniref:Anaphase-promoting complex subunit 10 n=1 Tax=Achaetomium macrosporum TaxID=79813 RepID=A0AAN7HD59_9PEZI|nr:anaphase-promoting complex subunit 10 [Achaetomium macrosporum]